MDFLVAAVVFECWLLLGYLTADHLADLASEPRPDWPMVVAGQVAWPVLAPLLVYVWWTGD